MIRIFLTDKLKNKHFIYFQGKIKQFVNMKS